MKTTLLIALFFCHFLADFTHLSTAWMLAAKRLGKPLGPIFVHAMWHGCLMGILLCMPLIREPLFWLSLVWFQIITHFIIDVLKGRINGWFPVVQNPANKVHWVVFGADQFLHAVVIILMWSVI